MKLQEVFDQLTHGELSQLSIGGNEAGVISPANYNRLVPHVNLGLTQLYKRFPLKEGRLKLELQDNRTVYPIHSKYAVSSRSSREPVRYIKDSLAAPFKDDIHKIEKVVATSGYEFSLNDESDEYSMFTPSATVLRISLDVVEQVMDLPDELKTTQVEVVYRANHPLIIADGADLEPDLIELELPYTHLEPLLLFIASRVHTPTGMTNEANLGNTYAAKYEAACQLLENKGLQVDQGSQNSRLYRNGWV
jgi:hypothetical protein